ncbi:MAG: thioredoxin family protein [Anaerolineae bacterium]
MNVKVLGSGCPNCKRLEQVTREALRELGLDDQVEKVTNFADIVKYPILATPALVIDEKVVCFGRVPSTDEIKGWLKNGHR